MKGTVHQPRRVEAEQIADEKLIGYRSRKWGKQEPPSHNARQQARRPKTSAARLGSRDADTNNTQEPPQACAHRDGQCSPADLAWSIVSCRHGFLRDAPARTQIHTHTHKAMQARTSPDGRDALGVAALPLRHQPPPGQPPSPGNARALKNTVARSRSNATPVCEIPIACFADALQRLCACFCDARTSVCAPATWGTKLREARHDNQHAEITMSLTTIRMAADQVARATETLHPGLRRKSCRPRLRRNRSPGVTVALHAECPETKHICQSSTCVRGGDLSPPGGCAE